MAPLSGNISILLHRKCIVTAIEVFVSLQHSFFLHRTYLHTILVSYCADTNHLRTKLFYNNAFFTIPNIFNIHFVIMLIFFIKKVNFSRIESSNNLD